MNKKLNSNQFKSKALKLVENMDNILMFSAYLPEFKGEENQKIFLDLVFSKFLSFLYSSEKLNKVKDSILLFLSTGKLDDALEDILEEMTSINVFLDFSEFIIYRKLNPENIYDQRLVEMSIYINKYKTMQKLLFTSYPDIAFSDVGVAKLDKLLGTWNALNYDDIIDFLIYHSFISYPSLNADGILKEYFELNFDKALSTLSKLQGKRLYDGLDIFYKKSKVKTSKFILNNIEIFKDKTLIDKVISKIQVEKLSKNKMEILLNHQESHVREIASLLR